MAPDFGRRKSDTDFVIQTSQEIGRLKEGYDQAARAFQTVLANIAKLDEKVDKIHGALYGEGLDGIGIFERIRHLAYKLGVVFTLLAGLGGFIGRYLEKVILK